MTGTKKHTMLVKEGRFTDALALIKKDNPFPDICGRVCNKRCEAARTRGTIDALVADPLTYQTAQPGTSLTIGRNRRDFIELDKEIGKYQAKRAIKIAFAPKKSE